jgi:hypothetical protein
MSVYKIFPLKDATIYSGKPTINAGRDEVLEVSSINSSNAIGVTEGLDDIRRSLIKFSDQDLDTIYNLASGSTYETRLKLYLAYASALPQDYTIECYPVYEDWVMGTGKYADSPNPKNGVSWYTVGAYENSSNWTTTQGTQAYLYTTGGGTWNATYKSTQSFDYIADKDIDLTVTNITNVWNSNTVPNYGFILKQTGSIELTPSSSIETKFFSMDTHTIYPPCLEMRWDDSIYSTGSNSNGIINQDDFVLLAENNIGNYKEDEKYRFRFKTRERFPARNFTTSSEYLNWKYLPRQSYWAIQDYKTKEMIIDFDSNYTKLSADTNGNYFTLYTSGLQPERSYKVLVKAILPNSSEVVIDNDIIIKVGR